MTPGHRDSAYRPEEEWVQGQGPAKAARDRTAVRSRLRWSNSLHLLSLAAAKHPMIRKVPGTRGNRAAASPAQALVSGVADQVAPLDDQQKDASLLVVLLLTNLIAVL